MISKGFLQEVIVENEDHILKDVGRITPRIGLSFPESSKKVVVVYGVRRSGKTYVLFELFRKFNGNALYVDFEDERLSKFQVGDFEGLKESFFELKPHLPGKEAVFLLDEVQNVEGWEKFCRRLVERENIKVFVSGSSSKVLPSEMHTALRGRSWGIELLPFSFSEYLAAKGYDLNDVSLIHGRDRPKVKREFLQFLKWGGFPEVAFLKADAEKSKVIREYLGAMFFRDLVERYEITNITLLDALTDSLLSSSALKFSLAAFYKQHKDQLSFSKDSLYLYYKHFLESMLIFEMRKFSPSAYKRLRNPPKIYLVDTGISRHVSSSDTGRLLENTVYLELRRRGFEMFYYNEKNECDFIMKDQQGGLACAQVTFELNEKNRIREIAGLVDACKALGLKDGTIFTYDEEEHFRAEGINISVIPFWRWSLTTGTPKF